MPHRQFTLEISGHAERSGTDHADEIYEAGCDDATVFTGDGEIAVKFTREAGSLDSAIVSAVEQLTSAGYSIVRVEKELASDAA